MQETSKSSICLLICQDRCYLLFRFICGGKWRWNKLRRHLQSWQHLKKAQLCRESFHFIPAFQVEFSFILKLVFEYRVDSMRNSNKSGLSQEHQKKEQYSTLKSFSVKTIWYVNANKILFMSYNNEENWLSHTKNLWKGSRDILYNLARIEEKLLTNADNIWSSAFSPNPFQINIFDVLQYNFFKLLLLKYEGLFLAFWIF